VWFQSSEAGSIFAAGGLIMSALGAIFNIAGSALSVQKYGIEVTANNIANVNTPGYTRQSPLLEPSLPEKNGPLLLGRGVSFESVISIKDQFVETRLRNQESLTSFHGEQHHYVSQIEQIFNTGAETDVSSLMSGFWNSWHELANSPSGTSERLVLAEKSGQLAEGFNRLHSQMRNLVQDIDNRLYAGAKEVNLITSELADLNQQIMAAETGGKTSHALRDLQNNKLRELAQYIDITSFERDNGSLTIMTANGIDLVRGNQSYDLSMENGRLLLAGSGQNQWDITDKVSAGRIGGWVDMRDNVIPGFLKDLNATAGALIWQVNTRHSQGVGLEMFSAVTGEYSFDAAVDVNTTPVIPSTESESGLDFHHRIVPGSFTLWVYDEYGNPVDADPDADGISGYDIPIDETMTFEDLINAFNPSDPADPETDPIPGLIARITEDNRFQITTEPGSGYTFGFSDDTSHVLAALGINTFFKGHTAETMAVSNRVASGGPYIAAGTIGSDGRHAAGDNSNAMGIADLQYTPMRIGDELGHTGVLETTTENYFHTLLGGIGVTGSGMIMEKDTSVAIRAQLAKIRESISGVSLDEEMVSLMTFQAAYSAAAKLITTADEMLDTLLRIR
jgi:flagellar hook-associated protein 1